MCSWTASVGRVWFNRASYVGPQNNARNVLLPLRYMLYVLISKNRKPQIAQLCKMDQHGCSMDINGPCIWLNDFQYIDGTISAPPHFIRFHATVSHFPKFSPENFNTKNEEIFPGAARGIGGHGTSESLGVFPSHSREVQSQAQTFHRDRGRCHNYVVLVTYGWSEMVREKFFPRHDTAALRPSQCGSKKWAKTSHLFRCWLCWLCWQLWHMHHMLASFSILEISHQVAQAAVAP